jgi:hypothetical protein
MSGQLIKQKGEATALRRNMELLKTEAAKKGIFLGETEEEQAASSEGGSAFEQREQPGGHDDNTTGSPN